MRERVVNTLRNISVDSIIMAEQEYFVKVKGCHISQ